MTQLLQELKQATAKAHRQLDHHPLLMRLLQRDLTLAQYRQSLSFIWAAHSELEQQVCEFWQRHDYDYCPESRSAVLAAELGGLDISTNELKSTISRTATELAPLKSLSAAVGATYVLEGSRLGGVVLARAIEKRLAGHRCLFFAGTDSNDGVSHWQKFQAFCGAHQHQIDSSVATASALESFECYYAVINGNYSDSLDNTTQVGTAVQHKKVMA